jgi:hypothetical protein
MILDKILYEVVISNVRVEISASSILSVQGIVPLILTVLKFRSDYVTWH